MMVNIDIMQLAKCFLVTFTKWVNTLRGDNV